jgi:hypothetical protein
LALVRFAPALDTMNRAPRGTRFSMPLTVQRLDGASTGIRSVTVAASYDRGRTWTRLRVTGSGTARTAHLTHPSAAGSVSLRATVVHADGNRVDQRIINAYLTR